MSELHKFAINFDAYPHSCDRPLTKAGVRGEEIVDHVESARR